MKLLYHKKEEIRWLLTAGGDLQAIEDLIAKDSILHAANFIDR